ncbi:MAG: hypothetical protein ABMA64_07950 [Myxococcota bacterium]
MRQVLMSVELRDLELGAVVARSTQQGEELQGEVAALYLVTARPGGRTWLVGVLRRPTYDGTAWNAEPNTVPLTDVSRLVTAGGPARELTAAELEALDAAITADRSPAPAPAPGAVFDPATDRWELGARDADGLRIGAWRTWRRDGTPWVEEHRVDDCPDGIHRTFHPDGALAIEARWAGGHPASATFHAPQVPTDVPGFDQVPARVATWDEVGDGGYGVRAIRWRDRRGEPTTAAGDPEPPRPDGVPDTARFEDRAGAGWVGWVDGAVERATRRPIGLWRWWTPSGALSRVTRYDPRGRQRSSFDTVAADPRDAAIATFLADPTPFRSGYDLGQLWDDEVHQQVVRALDSHPPDRLSAYLEVLEELPQYGRGGAGWKVARPDLGWALVLPRLGSLDRAALAEAARWASALHDVARLTESWSRFLATDPEPRIRAELEPTVLAALDGTSGAQLDRHLAALRSGGDVPTDGFVALATRELGVLGLKRALGERAPELVLVDPEERAYGWVGDRFDALPLRVDQRGTSLRRYFTRHDRIDERVVRWSGKSVWSTTVRFGTTIWLQGSSYFSSRGQPEVVTDLLVECPTLGWTRRVEQMFAAESPTAKVVDPTYHPKLAATLVREYRGRFGAETRSWSRGVHGAVHVAAGSSPGVTLLEMNRGGPGPVRVATYPSADEARAAFDRAEFRWFQEGHSMMRVVALPMPPLAPLAPSPAPRAPRAAKTPTSAPVAARVDAELGQARPGDRASTLAAVREAWARRPAPELADALDRLADAQAAAGMAGKSKAAIARWDEAEATRDPAVVPSLMATLGDAPSPVVTDRLERLAQWPEDPRIDRAVVELAYQVPFTATSTMKAWRRMFDRIAASRDARILPRLRELPERYEHAAPGEPGWARDRVEKILAAREALLESFAGLTLDPEDRARLAALASPPPEPSGSREDRIAEILANPGDRGLRERYAAQFAASGDVRAELLALQLQVKPDKGSKARIKELERAEGPALAGPLARWLKSGPRFALGFLSECALRSGEADPPVDSPYWATVEVLDAGSSDALAASPALRSLRELRDVRAPFAWPDRPRLESLAVALLERGDLAALAENALPALHTLELDLGRPHQLADLNLDPLTGPLGRGLHTLGWTHRAKGGSTNDRTIVPVLERSVALLPELPRLERLWAKVEYGYFTATYTFVRVEDRFELKISAPPQRFAGWWDVFEDNIAALLMGLAGTRCRAVRFDLTATDPTALRDRLDAIDGVEIDVTGIRGAT